MLKDLLTVKCLLLLRWFNGINWSINSTNSLSSSTNESIFLTSVVVGNKHTILSKFGLNFQLNLDVNLGEFWGKQNEGIVY